MKKRCLILACGVTKKDKFISDICDALIDIGDVPSLLIDAADIKSADINVPEMVMESDALIVIYRNDPDDSKDDIWNIVNAAELGGLHLAYLYPDKKYKSLSRYLTEALD